MSAGGRLTLAALRLGTPLAGRRPGPAYALARAAGRLICALRPRARARVTANLTPACGGDRGRARALAPRVFECAASYYVDLATLPYRDHGGYEREHLTVMGWEHVPTLFEARPTIIASAHVGGPELALIAIAQRGRSWVELVEPLSPPALARHLAGLREAAGGRVAEANANGFRQALRELRGGGLVTLVVDRDLAGNGVCAQLLGRGVLLPRGPWELARRTGATVIPLFAQRHRGDDQTVWLERPFTVPAEGDREEAVRAAAQRWADLFGERLRHDPAQWTVLESFWEAHACG